MRTNSHIFCILLLLTQPCQDGLQERFIVWNVGQGQWATLITADQCLHFDSGGEFAPFSAIKRQCRLRENRFYFSHWDWDHISFANRASRELHRTCLAAAPSGHAKPKKQKALANLSLCKQTNSSVLEIHPPTRGSLKTSNESSRVFLALNQFLIPGDSPQKQERLWSQKIVQTRSIKTLVLGHHGSKTSTSNELLDKLVGLKLTIASQRRSRYGHPHFEVIKKIRARGLPMLETEIWGSISIEVTKDERVYTPYQDHVPPAHNKHNRRTH